MYRLLLKTHNKTGLKYLCKTVKDDWVKYTGSGKYWLNHLREHGRDISTELLYETDDFHRFKDVAIIESIKRDVVNSKEYANLMVEKGDGGFISAPWLGKKRPNMTGNRNPAKRSEVRKLISKNNPMRRPECRKLMSQIMMGNKNGNNENSIAAISGFWKGRKQSAEHIAKRVASMKLSRTKKAEL